jgi:membrane protein involved in D-alanine export
MIPYADFTFFGIMLYAVIPTLILGFMGRLGAYWAFFITLLYLIGQFSGQLELTPGNFLPLHIIVAGYAAYQWLLATLLLGARRRSKSGLIFCAALLLALAPLATAKFLPLVSPHAEFGFLGVSYVTFRVLDILFCVHDGLITSLPAPEFFTYLFFFPTLSAGPIDRYRRFGLDWKRVQSRQDFLVHLDTAVERIFRGFLYKFILAALVKRFWVDHLTDGSFASTISYMYGYSLYLFFDFAGYTAFAIGFSYLFGIRTPENFNAPFLATNIRDFWNRWNITLSFWFRDHVYMRFLIAAAKHKWYKNDQAASYLGYFLAFGLMGLWHGSELHYIVYGVYHACLLMLYDLFSRWNKRRQFWRTGGIWRLASIVVTVHFVCFGFLIFSGRLNSAGTGRQIGPLAREHP